MIEHIMLMTTVIFIVGFLLASAIALVVGIVRAMAPIFPVLFWCSVILGVTWLALHGFTMCWLLLAIIGLSFYAASTRGAEKVRPRPRNSSPPARVGDRNAPPRLAGHPRWEIEQEERRRSDARPHQIDETIRVETRRRLEAAEKMVWNPGLHRWETPVS